MKLFKTSDITHAKNFMMECAERNIPTDYYLAGTWEDHNFEEYALTKESDVMLLCELGVASVNIGGKHHTLRPGNTGHVVMFEDDIN